jgi:DNA polymerase-3 subunit gamma/tau
MAYTVLARRYRSTTFDDVIGQDHVAQTLKKAIDSGRVAHAYLFCGTRGVGKTSMARILAKALNCEAHPEATSSPCGKCNSCLAIARGEDLDVIEIDAASNRGIDNIRDLISNAQFSPARSRFKIYIIDEVHGLSKDAFNALLKVLEEPPSHVKFILATTEPEKVLPTILSRCQRYDFRNIAAREIAGHLADICKKEKIKADEDALMLLAKAGAGSMRDALSLLDRMLSVGEKHLDMELVERLLGLPKSQLIFDLASAIAGGDVKGTLGRASSLVDSGLSVDSLLAALVDHVRNLLIIRTCGPDSELVEAPGLTMPDLTAQAERFDPIALTQDITILEELRRQIRQSQAGRALLDATLVRMALSDQFSSIGDLLTRLDGGEPAETQKKNDRAAPAQVVRQAAVYRSVDPPVVGVADADPGSTTPATVAAGAARTYAIEGRHDHQLHPQAFAVETSAAPASPIALAPAQSGPLLPAPATATNVEPVNTDDLPQVWRAMLSLLAAHGQGLQSLLTPGKLTSVEEGRAIVRFGSQHETFVKMLDRNGKKELVRDGLSKVLGQPVGVMFEVEPEVLAAVPAAPMAKTVVRSAAQPVERTADVPAPARPAPVTPEMVDEICRSSPLVAALMQTLGATILKVE